VSADCVEMAGHSLKMWEVLSGARLHRGHVRWFGLSVKSFLEVRSYRKEVIADRKGMDLILSKSTLKQVP